MCLYQISIAPHIAAHDGQLTSENRTIAAANGVTYVPNAQLRIFPDAAHGFLFQYPKEFAELVNQFLEAR